MDLGRQGLHAAGAQWPARSKAWTGSNPGAVEFKESASRRLESMLDDFTVLHFAAHRVKEWRVAAEARERAERERQKREWER